MFQNMRKLITYLIVAACLLSTTAFQSTQTGSAGEAVARITQVDTSQFPKVTVYISVTDPSGEPVGVSLSQIVLMENGVIVTPDEVKEAGEFGQLSTMLVLDVSGSMNSSGKLLAAKQAAQAFVEQMRPNDYTGLLAFNTQVDYVQPLTSDQKALREAIASLKARDDTAMYDALQQAIQLLEPAAGRKAIIVLTDGLDNRSRISPLEIIQLIGPQGLSISTVGLGDPSHSTSAISSLNEPALIALAEEAGGAYGYASDAESLTALYERYGRALQSEYVISYTSPSKLRDGVNRSLSVALQEPGGESVTAETTVKFNPGGLVPEVAEGASWGVFVTLLLVLIGLLFVPSLIKRIAAVRNPKSKIKLVGSSKQGVKFKN